MLSQFDSSCFPINYNHQEIQESQRNNNININVNYLELECCNMDIQQVEILSLNNESIDNENIPYICKIGSRNEDFKIQEFGKSDSQKYKKIFHKLKKLNIQYMKSLLIQAQFPTYLKCSIQVLKKVNQSKCLSSDMIKFIVHYALLNNLDQQYIEVTPKIIRLCQEFDKITDFQLVNMKQFLENDTIQNIWSKQQIIQCFLLFILTKCEAFISNFNNKEKEQISDKDFQSHTNMCTYDYSWSENCFGNIRDYFPKLASKINKRYQIVRNLNQEDKQQSIAIFNYAQSVLGYYHHHYSYSQMKLDREDKNKIKQILQNKMVECDLQTVIIVANARMFVQLLYSLNDLQKI